MNIIYTSPLRQFKTFLDYATFLVRRWILSSYRKGFIDVRILFDQVDTQGLSPKAIERSRRDESGDDIEANYNNIADDTVLPANWFKFLKVRTQKHCLIRYLSSKFIELVKDQLLDNQIFITSGGFHVGLEKRPNWTGVKVTKKGTEYHSLIHNHEESDTQIFLHVFDTQCTDILIYSIDRDIGIIGIPLEFGSKTVCIQYRSKVGEEKYLNINLLQTAIMTDSDLSCIVDKDISILKCVQMIYICSGCDFVSYFAHVGKSMFFNVFVQYASFISGDSIDTLLGNLTCSTVGSDSDKGLLSFYRFILCVYFKANRAFLHDYDSPLQLFNTVSGTSVLIHHQEALAIVRKASWIGTYEDQLLPSNTALRFHWLRACWVSSVWGQCTIPLFQYPDIGAHGFSVLVENGISKVDIVWDSKENIKEIQNNVAYLTRGCSCAKNKCSNKRCKCKKQGNFCGPGCTCRSCENVKTAHLQNPTSVSLIESDNSDDSDYTSSDESDLELNDSMQVDDNVHVFETSEGNVREAEITEFYEDETELA